MATTPIWDTIMVGTNGADDVILPLPPATFQPWRLTIYQALKGDDTISGSSWGEEVEGMAGDDTIHGNGGNDYLLGGEGSDHLYGDEGNDWLRGGGLTQDAVLAPVGTDSFFGGAGDDVIQVEKQPDSGNVAGGNPLAGSTYDGGEGRDIFLVWSPYAGRMDLSGYTVTGFEILATRDFSVDQIRLTGAQLAQFGYLWTAEYLEIRITTAGTVDLSNVQATSALAFYLPDAGPNTFTLPQIDADYTRVTIDRHLEQWDFGATDFGPQSRWEVYGGTAADTINGSHRRDYISGGGGDDKLYGFAGDDEIEGGAGNDTIFSGIGDEKLRGGIGNDRFYFGKELTKNDDVDGGSGNDAVVLQGDYNHTFVAKNLVGIESVWLLSGSESDFVPASDARYSYVLTMDDAALDASRSLFVDGRFLTANEPVWFAGQNETDADLIVWSGASNDTLIGGAGDDELDGDAGFDWLQGGLGDDVYWVDSVGDVVFEFAGQGEDEVYSSASHYMFSGVENLTLLDDFGNIFGVGNELNNTITGNDADNLLLAGFGADVAFGGAGVDIIYGQEGNDQLFGEAGNDALVGGIGNDVIDGGIGADVLYGEEGDDKLTGGTDFIFDQLVGGDGNDELRGDSGQGDFDHLYGGTGDDRFYVDTYADLVFEQANEGTDTVYANIIGAGYYLYENIEDLVLLGETPYGVGNGLANKITGSAAANWLLGGAGDDLLNGKGGNDVLFGEAGADTFVFEAGAGGDTIGDFTAGTDKIDLSALGYTNFSQVQARFHENGGSTAIDLGNGDFIVLNGVASNALHAGDFILGSAKVAADHPADIVPETLAVSPMLWHSAPISGDLLF